VQDDRDWHRRYESRRDAEEAPMSDDPINADVTKAARASWRAWIKRPNVLRDIARLPMPYTAVIGSLDIRPAWPVAQVASLAPRGQLVVINGAGHEPWRTHPTEVARALAPQLTET
jgi:proline iminopeptidase